jgi:hypothetical protein
MTVRFLSDELSALAKSARRRRSKFQLLVDIQNVSGSFHLDVFGNGMDHHYTGKGGGSKFQSARMRRSKFQLSVDICLAKAWIITIQVEEIFDLTVRACAVANSKCWWTFRPCPAAFFTIYIKVRRKNLPTRLSKIARPWIHDIMQL